MCMPGLCIVGLVWSLRPNDVDVELIRLSKEMMTTLEDETGVNTGWINNGGMFIASTKERMDEYKRLLTVGKICRGLVFCTEDYFNSLATNGEYTRQFKNNIYIFFFHQK